MIRRLTRRVVALTDVINRATALADAREESVALAERVAHLEHVVAEQGRHVRALRRAGWRYWSWWVDESTRAEVAERALAELEPVVMGEQ